MVVDKDVDDRGNKFDDVSNRQNGINVDVVGVCSGDKFFVEFYDSRNGEDQNATCNIHAKKVCSETIG